MNREQWLADRRAGIGGSDAPAALGVSPWVTPYQLYRDKLGEALDVSSPALHWGTVLEPVIRQEYADRTGRTVETPQAMIHHPTWPIAFAHVDGVTTDDRLLECKTSRTADGWGETGTDEIPEPYLVQVQHCLACLSLPVADVAVLIGGSDFRIYEVPADEELQGYILIAEQRFWKHVETRTPPEPQTAEDVRMRWPKSTGRAVEAAEEVAKSFAKLARIKRRRKWLDAIEEPNEMTVKAALADGDTLTWKGKTLATWKTAKASKRLDVEALKTRYPDAYAACLTEGSGSRRFLLKEPKE